MAAPRTFWERCTLGWVFPIVWKGYSTALEEEDIPDLMPEGKSESLIEPAKRAFEETQSFASVLWRLNKGYVVWGCVTGAIQGLLNTVGRPFILRAVLAAALSESLDTSRLILLLFVFGIIVFFEGIFGVMAAHILTDTMGTRFATLASILVIDKSTKKRRDFGNGGSATEASLAGNDIIRTMENFRLIGWFPMSIAALIGGVIVLLLLIGVSSTVGLAVMFLIVAINRYISTLTKKEAKLNLQAGDQRLSLMKQMINGIQALKMHGWEQRFLETIESVRAVECAHIQKFRILQVSSIALGRASPVLASCSAFITFALLGGELRPADVFAALTIFQALRMPLIMIPLNFTAIANVSVSFKRIGEFLKSPSTETIKTPEGKESILHIKHGDFAWSKIKSSSTTPRLRGQDTKQSLVRGSSLAPLLKKGSSKQVNRSTFHSQATQSELKTVGGNDASVGNVKSIEMKGISVEMPGGPLQVTWTLKDINIDIRAGSKVAIVGAVGCGKTSLLHSILGDMISSKRTELSRISDIGWVPQKAFVLSASVRENILMGRPYDKKRFDWAIWASAMETDLKLLSKGEHTQVGERGTTLSGGQQMRVGIARAMYAMPQLLVLDDPLAAVDAQVCDRIFKRCVEDFMVDRDSHSQNALKASDMKTRCVVMALNQVHLLPRFDYVIYMKNGVIVDQGSYSDIAGRNKEGFGDLMNASGHSVDQALSESDAKKDGKDIKSKGKDKMSEEKKVNDDSKDDGKDTGLTTKEHRDRGAVNMTVIKTYLRSMGICFVILCGVVLCAAYAMFVFNDVWLAIWASRAENNSRDENLFFIGVYIATSVGHVCLILTMSILMSVGGVRASSVLHSQTLMRVMRAPTSWFNATPSGRIVSRFSSDLSIVDIRLALDIDNFLQIGAIIVVLLGTMCVVVPEVTGFVVFGFALYCFLVLAVDRSNREVRRMLNNLMSPLLTNFNESSNARLLAQAMGFIPFFVKRHFAFTNKYSAGSILSYSILSFGRLSAHLASFIIAIAMALLILLQREQYSETQISLGFTYAFLIPYFLMIQTLNTSFLQNGLTTLERVLQYKSSQIPQESQWRSEEDPDKDKWPKAGKLTFKDVWLQYRPDLPPSIKGASFSLNPGERCGVVGRTGAGKSSLVVLLFRIVEALKGQIEIDGKNIKDLGLQTVREAIEIIPQQPLLLNTTVRGNIDPFGEFEEQEIVDIVKDVGLSSDMLEMEIEGGSGLSAGEKQMISFARSALRGAKIVVMDEPTANVDAKTDSKLQELVRSRFRKATVITIAHRLSTIIDNDKILVMDKGVVKEFGPAAQLLQNPDGIFTSLVNATGKDTARKLREKAERAYATFRSSKEESKMEGKTA